MLGPGGAGRGQNRRSRIVAKATPLEHLGAAAKPLAAINQGNIIALRARSECGCNPAKSTTNYNQLLHDRIPAGEGVIFVARRST